jgi:exosortase/archaeosortase family protein
VLLLLLLAGWLLLMMLLMIVPLCLLMNGLRIAMIGMVGEQWGAPAGAAFHDWSGYIMLLICFWIIFKAARLLGWKE